MPQSVSTLPVPSSAAAFGITPEEWQRFTDAVNETARRLGAELATAATLLAEFEDAAPPPARQPHTLRAALEQGARPVRRPQPARRRYRVRIWPPEFLALCRGLGSSRYPSTLIDGHPRDSRVLIEFDYARRRILAVWDNEAGVLVTALPRHCRSRARLAGGGFQGGSYG